MSPFFVTEIPVNKCMQTCNEVRCQRIKVDKVIKKCHKDFWDDQGNYTLLHSHLKNKTFDRIIDIGAWWGPWTMCWRAMATDVEIFEPNKKILPMLRQNIEPFENCHLHQVALGDVPGNVTMKPSSHSGTYHITDDNGNVDIKTLDSFNFDCVDIIKIDAEGYEIPVLQGARETIVKNKPWIQIEANKASHRYGYTKKMLHEFLLDLGMVRVAKKWPDQIWKF